MILFIFTFCLTRLIAESKSVYVQTDSRFDIVIVVDQSCSTDGRIETSLVDFLPSAFPNVGSGENDTRIGLAFCAVSSSGDSVVTLDDGNDIFTVVTSFYNQKQEDRNCTETLASCLLTARLLFETTITKRQYASKIVFIATDGIFVETFEKDHDLDFLLAVAQLLRDEGLAVFVMYWPWAVDNQLSKYRNATNSDYLLQLAGNDRTRLLYVNYTEKSYITSILKNTLGVGIKWYQDCEMDFVQSLCRPMGNNTTINNQLEICWRTITYYEKIPADPYYGKKCRLPKPKIEPCRNSVNSAALECPPDLKCQQIQEMSMKIDATYESCPISIHLICRGQCHATAVTITLGVFMILAVCTLVGAVIILGYYLICRYRKNKRHSSTETTKNSVNVSKKTLANNI